MKRLLLFIPVFLLAFSLTQAQTLRVKEGRTAILKEEPTGNGKQIMRIPSGTEVQQTGNASRYYGVSHNGQAGWAYKGAFEVVSGSGGPAPNPTPTKESLLARTDLLEIIVIDVEVGDATLILCPEDNGKRDAILIDCGMSNDGDRIRNMIASKGFSLTDKPLTSFIATHHDGDHVGSIADVAPLTSVIYDHGTNHQHTYYSNVVDQPIYYRRTMTVDYVEQFSGGVTFECVASNNATDHEPNRDPAPEREDKNQNSIALIVSYGGFDYFTGGDLTKDPERSLAAGELKNCDVYHVNHHGSSRTSSTIEFVTKLDPEVSVVSNGTSHGHPTSIVANRLINDVGSKFYQTNVNRQDKAHQPPAKYIADDTFHHETEDENAEGAKGNIHIVVDPEADKYYVIMPGLDLSEATFDIEH